MTDDPSGWTLAVAYNFQTRPGEYVTMATYGTSFGYFYGVLTGPEGEGSAFELIPPAEGTGLNSP
jgi:hypothetical protein